MARLTVKRPDGRWAIASSDNASPTERVMKIPTAIDRLAAYEDTGLEPEEITTAFQGQKAIFDLHFSVDQKRIAHLLELLQAEQEGRLVVLPVRPAPKPMSSNTVYRVLDGEMWPDYVYEVLIGEGNDGKLNAIFSTDENVSFELADFGKTVFLKEEDAETALKKGAAEGG